VHFTQTIKGKVVGGVTVQVKLPSICITEYVVRTEFKYKNTDAGWTYYPLINLFGENYVPLLSIGDPLWKCHVDKLAKPVLDTKDKYTLKTGEFLDLGSGYSLEAKQVDVDGKKVWLQLNRSGQYVDEQIVSTGTGDHTWTCTLNNIQGVNNVIVLKVHVSQVFQGAVDSIAQIEGIWLIDYANLMTLVKGDQFGNLALSEIVFGVDDNNLGHLVFKSH
jgi:S-layer protein (TIGR01567 family)